MNPLIKSALSIIFFLGQIGAVAQDDLMNLIKDTIPDVEPVRSIFNGTRIINGHSVETRGAGTLEVIFMHRFGALNSGAYNFWGLDEAWIRLGLEYSITDDLTVGLGRSSYEKTYDGFLKYRFVEQTKGARNFPFTATGFVSMAINTLKPTDPEQEIQFSSRLSYAYQVLMARKFNKNLSLQLMPTLVHHNLVATPEENNDIFALGFGGRYKVSRRLALTLEYYYQFNNNTQQVNYDALGVGLEIETGGHVFQIVFSNSRAMIEKSFITETTGNFFDGDIHLGFNITRAFYLKKKKPKEEW
jgi:hypothetical protein